jgi:hypothetical protein
VLTRFPPTVRWTIETPGHWAHTFAAEPGGRSLLIADGWGVAYRSLSLHRVDLGTGELVRKRRIGDVMRCFAFDEGSGRILVACDKRLRLLEADSLAELERWDRRVPRYANGIAWRGRKVLMRTETREAASVFDLDTGRHRRWQLGEIGAASLNVLDDGRIITGGHSGPEGSIWQIDSLDGSPRRLAVTPPMHSVAVDDRGAIWLAPGVSQVRGSAMPDRADDDTPARVGLAWIEHGRPTRELLRYDDGGAEPATVRAPGRCRIIAASRGELWLARESRRWSAAPVVDRMRVDDGTWLEPLRAPRGHRMAALLPEAGIALTSRAIGDAAEIACLAVD